MMKTLPTLGAIVILVMIFVLINIKLEIHKEPRKIKNNYKIELLSCDGKVYKTIHTKHYQYSNNASVIYYKINDTLITYNGFFRVTDMR